MNRVLLSAIFSAFTAATAAAADLPPPAPPPAQAPAVYVPAPEPVYNWAGVYLGINGGWGWGGAKWTANTGVGNISGTPDDHGGVVGATLGVNFQAGALVFGIDGDWDYSAINTGTSSSLCNLVGTCQSGNNWLFTLRGRGGYAFDRALLYLTAGGAFGNVETTLNGVNSTKTQAGWTAGLGLEYAFAQNWSARIEYLYVNLGTGSASGVCGKAACLAANAGAPLPFNLSTGLTENLLRFGVDYKFAF
jgi:outer membrane immunogenic protein